MRLWVAVLFVLVTFASAAPAGPRNTRAEVIERALTVIDATATNADSFSRHGNDLLWCLFSIAETSRDPHLRTQSLHRGADRAIAWRRQHPHVPTNASPEALSRLVQGAYAAARLGQEDPVLEAELRVAAGRYSARDFLKFDAPHEPPSASDPRRFDVYTDALIDTWFGDAYGVRLGASYGDVLQWLPRMRPYREGDDDLEVDEFYAVTHVIYTLGDYLQRRVSPTGLDPEIAFLKYKMTWAIANRAPEIIAEGIDSLKALGMDDDPVVGRGEAYLVNNQRPDGTWAGDKDDIYTLYHSAWAGIDALRDHRFHASMVTIAERLTISTQPSAQPRPTPSHP